MLWRNEVDVDVEVAGNCPNGLENKITAAINRVSNVQSVATVKAALKSRRVAQPTQTFAAFTDELSGTPATRRYASASYGSAGSSATTPGSASAGAGKCRITFRVTTSVTAKSAVEAAAAAIQTEVAKTALRRTVNPTVFSAQNVQQSVPSDSSSSTTTVTTSSGSATTTNAPTAAPTSAPGKTVAIVTTITQTATISIASVDLYTGATKELAEKGYGQQLAITDANGNYHEGCSVDSTASARRAITVAFSAKMPQARKAAAVTKAAELKANPSLLATKMTAIKASDTAKYAAVTVPTVSAMTTATATDEEVVSGASSAVTISVFAVIAGVLALWQ
jgi:hypothetical protein